MNTIHLPNYPYCILPSEINSVSSVCDSDTLRAFLSPSLRSYLNACKQDIGTELSKWDIFKRYTNPYEYVHTLIPGSRNAVCRDHPISRAYFKLFEIIKSKPKKFLSKNDLSKDKFRAISDFISGMTDRYAINLYNNYK